MSCEMNKETVRRWKAGWEAFNRWEAEQRRNQTFAERWAAFAAVDSLVASVNKPVPEKDVTLPRERWLKLKAVHFARGT